MNNILKVAIYELQQNIRRRGYLFATLGIPVLAFVILFGYQALNANNQPSESDQSTPFDIDGIEKAGYVDQSGLFSDVDAQLAGILVPFADEESARTALENDDIDVFYVIAEDYLETGNVTIHLPEFSLNNLNNAPLQGLVISTLAGDTDPSLITRLVNPSNIEVVDLSNIDGEQRDEDADFGALYLFSLVFLGGIFLTNGYLLQSVIEEKENRVIEVLLSSLTPTQLLSGKVLALGLLGAIQIVVWVVSLLIIVTISRDLSTLANTFIPNITLPLGQLPLMLVYFVLGYLFFAAAYGAVGALANSMRDGPQYAVIFTIPAAIPFYFFGIFAATPNDTLPVVLSMIPPASPLSMIMRMSITPVPLGEVLLSILLLAGSVVAMMWLAGRLFRVQTLLSGQTPKIRDIPRLILG